jgi:hypothetical protein
METHRNAKLGLSGRFALVRAREAGLSVRGGGESVQRFAGNRQPLVVPLACGER